MFSNTAYEAFYQYIGLSLHAKFIEVITSQKVFGSVLLFIFGVSFFLTLIHFFSRYMPGGLLSKESVPFSKFFQVTACLFLGVALLKANTSTNVKHFNNESWHQNAYIQGQLSEVSPEY
ncbi:hypothetical protein WDW86_05080 [Bdellovibrionota bacterium FG-2]